MLCSAGLDPSAHVSEDTPCPEHCSLPLWSCGLGEFGADIQAPWLRPFTSSSSLVWNDSFLIESHTLQATGSIG